MTPPGAIMDEAMRIANEFEYPATELSRAVEEFMHEMDEGLAQQGTTLSQIPSFITSVPDGSEEGVYLAIDLGGTNFRVCSVQLHGDSSFSMSQIKKAIPPELMVTEHGGQLFAFLAVGIEEFLRQHHAEHFAKHVEKRKTGQVTEAYGWDEVFELGFTFSFPVSQRGINKGDLFRWTKGFDIPEVVGKDVCELLQTAIDELYLPVRVAALVNDTVGTLMARSYSSPGKSKALIGAIFGTGTNGAYVEKLARVTKMDEISKMSDPACERVKTGEMVVNTEWGSFDNGLKVLPNTVFDKQLDRNTVNPGIQLFEKRISGMFLGEIFRLAVLSMVENPAIKLFSDTSAISDSDSAIPPNSPLYTPWSLDSSLLSALESTPSSSSISLHSYQQLISTHLAIPPASHPLSTYHALKHIAHAIGKRAARLGAVALSAIIISSGRLDIDDDEVDVGVDGSLIEHYPGFEEYLREAFREVKGIGPKGERRIRIGVAKDGSGVGAALAALVAGRS